MVLSKQADLFGFIEDPKVVGKLMKSETRIRKAYKELFSGYNLKAEDVLNEVVHVKNYPGVIIVHDINYYSFCEHHFLPFFGKARVCYQPGEIITGLGKIIRLVRDVHARRLQIQELMTRDIALDIINVLGARGVYVTTTAKHLCTCSRGPGDDSSETIVRLGLGSLAAGEPAGSI